MVYLVRYRMPRRIQSNAYDTVCRTGYSTPHKIQYIAQDTVYREGHNKPDTKYSVYRTCQGLIRRMKVPKREPKKRANESMIAISRGHEAQSVVVIKLKQSIR